MRAFVTGMVLLVAGAGCGDGAAGSENGTGVDLPRGLLARAAAREDPESRLALLEEALASLEGLTGSSRESRRLWARVRFEISKAQAELGRASDAAATGRAVRAELRRFLGQDPGDGAIRAELAYGLALDSEHDTAWKLLMAGTEVTDPVTADEKALVARATALPPLQELRGGEEGLQQALAHHRKFLVALIRRAAARQDGDWELALHELLGRCFLRQGLLVEAGREVAEIRRLDPAHHAAIVLDQLIASARPR